MSSSSSSSSSSAAASTPAWANVPDAPKELCCPVTHEIFTDPVVAADGRTYEKAVMEQIIKAPGTPRSPITNEELPNTVLITNWSMKSQCDRWREDNTGAKGVENKVNQLIFAAIVQAANPTAALQSLKAISEILAETEHCVLGLQGATAVATAAAMVLTHRHGRRTHLPD